MIALVYVAFVAGAVSAIGVVILHFQMKFRLLGAGLPVKWWMMLGDDFRMWRTYINEAPSRRWPIWPFYAYRVLYLSFGISAVLFLVCVTISRGN